MKAILNNKSVVIIANSHNPTVISDNFFVKSGIIKEFSEIDVNNLLITPAISQVIFKNGSIFRLDPQRLSITTTSDNELPYHIGQLYCNALPYIKCVAIGINFEYGIEEVDFDKWFATIKTIKFKDSSIKEIGFSFSNDDNSICLVKVLKNSNLPPVVTFNYHKDYGNITLGEINNDFIKQEKVYSGINIEFLKMLFA